MTSMRTDLDLVLLPLCLGPDEGFWRLPISLRRLLDQSLAIVRLCAPAPVLAGSDDPTLLEAFRRKGLEAMPLTSSGTGRPRSLLPSGADELLDAVGPERDRTLCLVADPRLCGVDAETIAALCARRGDRGIAASVSTPRDHPIQLKSCFNVLGTSFLHLFDLERTEDGPGGARVLVTRPFAAGIPILGDLFGLETAPGDSADTRVLRITAERFHTAFLSRSLPEGAIPAGLASYGMGETRRVALVLLREMPLLLSEPGSYSGGIGPEAECCNVLASLPHGGDFLELTYRAGELCELPFLPEGPGFFCSFVREVRGGCHDLQLPFPLERRLWIDRGFELVCGNGEDPIFGRQNFPQCYQLDAALALGRADRLRRFDELLQSGEVKGFLLPAGCHRIADSNEPLTLEAADAYAYAPSCEERPVNDRPVQHHSARPMDRTVKRPAEGGAVERARLDALLALRGWSSAPGLDAVLQEVGARVVAAHAGATRTGMRPPELTARHEAPEESPLCHLAPGRGVVYCSVLRKPEHVLVLVPGQGFEAGWSLPIHPYDTFTDGKSGVWFCDHHGERLLHYTEHGGAPDEISLRGLLGPGLPCRPCYGAFHRDQLLLTVSTGSMIRMIGFLPENPEGTLQTLPRNAFPHGDRVTSLGDRVVVGSRLPSQYIFLRENRSGELRPQRHLAYPHVGPRPVSLAGDLFLTDGRSLTRYDRNLNIVENLDLTDKASGFGISGPYLAGLGADTLLIRDLATNAVNVYKV